MSEFIAALRQLQRPLVLMAAAILVLQTLVAGLASAHAAARIATLATFGADGGAICHGNGDDGSDPATAAAHDCCVFCTNPGPVALSAGSMLVERLAPAHRAADEAHGSADIRRGLRAIRAGPSQAPPPAA